MWILMHVEVVLRVVVANEEVVVVEVLKGIAEVLMEWIGADPSMICGKKKKK